MSDFQNTPKIRPIPCKCGCPNKFIPTKPGQKFLDSKHRQDYWKRLQTSSALEDYQAFLLVRDKFRRYLKHESRINSWLKANKK